MSVDLTIVPARTDTIRDWFLAYDRLSVTRDYDLFDRIRKIPGRDFPGNTCFDWYDDEGLQTRTEDCYGDLLRYVKASELASVFGDDKDMAIRNKAIATFLRALPPDTWVVLWWH